MEEIKLQYNKKGQYRLTFPDGKSTEWCGYSFVLTAKWKSRKFVAFSHYWSGSGEFDMVGVHELMSVEHSFGEGE